MSRQRTGTSREPLFPSWSPPILLALGVVLFIGATVHVSMRGLPLLGFSHEIRFGEAITLDESRRALEGSGLYLPIAEPPYLLDGNGPFYPLVTGALISPEKSPYLTGRVLSLFATLFSAVMLAMIVRRRAGDAAGLIGAAVLLTLFEFLQYSYLMAADTPALAVALTAFYLAEDGRKSSRIVAVVGFILAAVTRPETLVLALAAYLRLSLVEGRQALRWPLGFIGGSLFFFIVASIWTSGGFYEHAAAYGSLPFSWPLCVENLVAKGLFPFRLPLVMAALLALQPSAQGNRISIWRWTPMVAAALICSQVFSLWSPETGLDESAFPWLLGLLAVLAVAGLSALLGIGAGKGAGRSRASGVLILLALAASVQVGRIGADVCSAYFETGALILIVCGEGFASSRGWKPLLLAGLLSLQVALSFLLTRDLGEFSADRISEMAYRKPLMEALATLEGPVLAEEPCISVGAGLPLMIDPYVTRQLHAVGEWDASDLIDEIEAAGFAAIVRAQSRVFAGFEEDEEGRPLRNPDGTLRPYFGPWTSNLIRSFPPEVQERINARYRRLEGASTRERVTPVFLYGIEVWVPRETEEEEKR